VIVQDVRAIRFHDCGDRVAMMMLLAVQPEAGSSFSSTSALDSNSVAASLDQKEKSIYQQFICVNTHLLFPHNEYSSNRCMWL
jgi:hypothetical protein